VFFCLYGLLSGADDLSSLLFVFLRVSLCVSLGVKGASTLLSSCLRSFFVLLL